ncbi:bifunctional ADP-heptose synthase [Pontibacter sp. G13]|uniref:bifunctional heptose 7-phosphate kinase/heptose 1-phosphate adenyltransferase n=1 Tax=Pontibacter sp. G13 TaxID=3074898 RepID=UPI00288A92BF|nr:bifunctional ADP-heptose synthase [Pontibacter sp. G13]WNJ17590.1 bifunctional ADP-heptose synthase [Pontibacter sp. G13]
MTAEERMLAQCQDQKVLVVGDLMLDRYLWGKVERISPEAPVPVVDIAREECRLGGAANVALNLRSLGATPTICGIVGQDSDGKQLIQLAEEAGFDTSLVHESIQRRTTTKTRVMGNQQQVLRVDNEDRFPLTHTETTAMLTQLLAAIPDFDGIILQDYDKCVLNPEMISRITHAARQADIPVMVDPKFVNFSQYQHCTLFKPNLKELAEGTGKRLDKRNLAGIQSAVEELRVAMPHPLTLVTLSENGMLLIDEALEAHHIPGHVCQIADVSGAGDTVIAVMALAMLSGLNTTEAAELANLSGSLVCEQLGVVPIKREQLRKEAPVRIR